MLGCLYLYIQRHLQGFHYLLHQFCSQSSASTCLWPVFSLLINHHLCLLGLLSVWTEYTRLPLYHGEHRVGKVSYRLNGGNIAALTGNCMELITHLLALLKPDCPGWQSSMCFSIKTSSFSPVCIICSLAFSLNFPSFQFLVFNFWAIYVSHLQKCHSASLHYTEGGKELPLFSCCGKHGPGLLIT